MKRPNYRDGADSSASHCASSHRVRGDRLSRSSSPGPAHDRRAQSQRGLSASGNDPRPEQVRPPRWHRNGPATTPWAPCFAEPVPPQHQAVLAADSRTVHSLKSSEHTNASKLTLRADENSDE
jgi:hypothetical protein